MTVARPLIAFAALAAALSGGPAWSVSPLETPLFEDVVKAGGMPPVAERLPADPMIAPMDRDYQEIGRQGGQITTLMSRAKDVRVIYYYSYARLVGYTPDLTIAPDILSDVEVEDGRIFTLRLRPGHKWSDGRPFTSEDFRYWWEDVVNNPELPPFGPPVELTVDGEAPTVTFPDPLTVRYSWSKPNPFFLPALAGAAPLIIYMPAHYLKPFHAEYADPEELRRKTEAAGQRGWAQLHNRVDNLSDMDNPDLPTLQPWRNTTAAPAERFIFERNPYYHRIDPEGRQLPYLDRIIVQIANTSVIPLKTGAGESDLQARYLRFDNYTFLKEAEKRNNFQVRLWETAAGAHLALYPNLNVNDPNWRTLFRDVRFRRALSLGVNREEINAVIYFGLATPSNNTVQPVSPLFQEEFQTAWTAFDPEQANALLDEIGLTKRNDEGIRTLPDGRPLEIIVETAGESSEEIDVLQLISESWRKIGVKLFIKPSQLEVFRSRIFAGDAMMVISKGWDNGMPTADMPPTELAPVDQVEYEWPKWGQYHQTKGQAGEAPDLPVAEELMTLYDAWRNSRDPAEREEIWTRMLEIHADQQLTIGLIAGTLQPVVVRNTLRNVPTEAVFNFEPGAHFGLYKPDSFWLETAP